MPKRKLSDDPATEGTVTVDLPPSSVKCCDEDELDCKKVKSVDEEQCEVNPVDQKVTENNSSTNDNEKKSEPKPVDDVVNKDGDQAEVSAGSEDVHEEEDQEADQDADQEADQKAVAGPSDNTDEPPIKRKS